MNCNTYRLTNGPFGRWIIVKRNDAMLAWSGSQWVLIGGDVQICNFPTEDEARQYAEKMMPDPSKLAH